MTRNKHIQKKVTHLNTADSNSMQATPVDNSRQSQYTLEQIRDAIAPILSQLDNSICAQVESESDTKGVSGMAKTYKQRVRIGIDEEKNPIYKWATGHTVDKMNDAIVRLYVEHGLIERFLHIDRSASPAKSDIPEFEAYAAKWFEIYKKPKLKPTTLQGYRSNLKQHLYPFFGQMRLDEITTDSVQQFLNERAQLAKNTLHTMFVVLGEILESAFEDHLIPSNPTKSKRISIPSEKKSERTALSPLQLKSIIAEISEKLPDDAERRLLSLMLFTGMRRGEVLGLRWEDIDFENRIIHVMRGVSYTTNQPIVSTPKTKSGIRTIPLDAQLSELLKPHQSCGYVIGGENPPTQMVTRRLMRHINKSVNLFGATPHVFRHSYISALAEAGVDLKTIQQISGHANVATTMGIYAHTRIGLVQEAGEKIAKLLA